MDSVVMDSRIKVLASPNHYTGRGQNLSVHTVLAWNEKKAIFVVSFHNTGNISFAIPFWAW